jgi:hypothetical protein
MSASTNKQIVEAFLEMFNQRNFDRFRDYIHEKFEYALETWIDRGVYFETKDGKVVISGVPDKSACTGKLQPGDEIVWAQEGDRVYDTFEAIRYSAWGLNPKVPVHLRVRRGEELIECDSTPYVEKGGRWAHPLEEWEKDFQNFQENTPEYHFAIEYLIEENDRVACIGSVTGINKKFNNRPFALSQALVFQIAEGKITTVFEVRNVATELVEQGYRILPAEEV